MSLRHRKLWPILLAVALIIPATITASPVQESEPNELASETVTDETVDATQSLAPEGLIAPAEQTEPEQVPAAADTPDQTDPAEVAPQMLQPRVATVPRPFLQTDEGRWDFVPPPQQLSEPTALTNAAANRQTPPASLASQNTHATPQLRVISQSPQSANIHRASQYRFRVINDGPVIAQAVNLTINIEGRGRVISTFPNTGVQQADAIYFSVGDLSVGQTREFGFEFQPDQAGQVRITPRVTSSSSGSVTTAVTAPRVNIEILGEKDFVVGQRISQTIRLRNEGTEAMRNLIVRQACTPTTSFEDAAFEGNRFIIPSLAPGQIAELAIRALAVRPGSAQIQIVVEGDNVRGLSSKNLDFAKNQLSAFLEGPELTYVNSIGTYSISVTNDQDRKIDDIRVKLELPVGMIVKILDRKAEFDAASSTITWYVNGLESGQTETIPFKATISQFGPHVLKASISNSAGTMTNAQMSTQAIGRADIDLKVITNPEPIEAGSMTSVIVQIQNRGTHDASDIAVQLQLPSAIEAIESADYETDGQQIDFETFQLAPGQTQNLTVPVNCLEPGDHIVRATVHSSASTKPIAAENSLFFFSSEMTRTAGRSSDDR